MQKLWWISKFNWNVGEISKKGYSHILVFPPNKQNVAGESCSTIFQELSTKSTFITFASSKIKMQPEVTILCLAIFSISQTNIQGYRKEASFSKAF